jgi:hypothetical protein
LESKDPSLNKSSSKRAGNVSFRRNNPQLETLDTSFSNKNQLETKKEIPSIGKRANRNTKDFLT